MLHYHLPLEDDETPYSWASAICLTLAYPSKKTALTEFFGAQNSQLATMFPGYMKKVCEHTHIPVDKLINRHSVLPISRLFTDRFTYQKAFNALANGTADIHTRLSLIANRSHAAAEVSYCPLCAANDEKALGRTYWHIGHQLPGINICTEHGTELVRIRPGRHEVLLPPVNCDEHINLSNERDLLLARMLQQAWSLDRPITHHQALNFLYRRKLLEEGYAANMNSIRQEKLRKELLEFWAQSQNIAVRQVLLKTDYPSAFLRKYHSNYFPIKHILLIAFLWSTWESFVDDIETIKSEYASRNEAPETHKDVNREPNTIVRMLKEGKSLRKVAECHRVSVTFVKKIAIQNKLPIDSRAQKLFGHEQQAIVEMLSRGAKTQVIAAKQACSVGAVEQVLAQRPELVTKRRQLRFIARRDGHREQILKSLSNGKELKRIDIQSENRSSYTWLFKHDKSWLNSVLPSAISRSKRYLGH